jgi:SAM-dependent methyltransferase
VNVTTPPTWHYGLIAEWWAEFNLDGPEIDYFGTFVEKGQPALDAGCGTGRLLVPWLRAGLDVDGCDVSADMIDLCRVRAEGEGLEPTLFVQALHELEPPRRYRTIVACGCFGLGSTRVQDQEALRRFHDALEPGGTLLLDNEVPYARAGLWRRWTKEERDRLPAPWPESGTRRQTEDGTEFELRSRTTAVDPLDQTVTMEMRAEKRRDGEVVAVDEARPISMRCYFRDELVLMLEKAGFANVEVRGDHNDAEPTADDEFLVFVTTRSEVD